MSEHNHITRGDVVGCPACDIREGRTPDPMRIPAEPEWNDPVEPDLSAFPEVQHSIVRGQFVCPGDENSRCHRYPGCDGEHETWPCGCEYIGHASCWIKPWIDAGHLADSHDEGADDYGHLISDADFPDGDVETSWEGDYVLWNYTRVYETQHDTELAEPSGWPNPDPMFDVPSESSAQGGTK